MKIKADALGGLLIWCAEGAYRLPVYTDDYQSTGYDLWHTDRRVTITDQTAVRIADDQG